MKKIGIILVRSRSKRLPNKCFLKFGSFSLIEHIIRRCRFYSIIPIVCTTNKYNDNEIVKTAKKLNSLYYRGSEKNKILRISECCKKFNVDYFHTIDADDPFFCGKEVSRSLQMLKENQLDIVEPTVSSSKGSGTVGYSIKSSIIHLIAKKINKNTNTEMMWGFFKKLKKIKIRKLSEITRDVKARLTLDYYEDYIFLETIRLLVGNFASRKDIFLLLRSNKDISKINLFRNKEWKKNQNKEIKKIR
jgi:spore coat polysaccharide biosynthesis protein SpsF (cytidylyltransferase family)